MGTGRGQVLGKYVGAGVPAGLGMRAVQDRQSEHRYDIHLIWLLCIFIIRIIFKTSEPYLVYTYLMY